MLAALLVLTLAQSAVMTAAQNFRRAWANGPSDVWFAGGNGVIRWNGSGFSTVPCSGSGCMDLWGVWGRGPDDMWIADRNSRLRHWDGGTFGPSITPTELLASAEGIGLFGAGDSALFVSAAFPDGGFGVLHYRR